MGRKEIDLKIRHQQIVKDYPDEFKIIDNNIIYCNRCKSTVNFDKRSKISQHRKTIKHASQKNTNHIKEEEEKKINKRSTYHKETYTKKLKLSSIKKSEKLNTSYLNQKIHPKISHKTLRSWNNRFSIRKEDLVLPLFVTDGVNIFKEIENMPEQYLMSVDKIEKFLKPLISNGLKSVLIFGTYSKKNGLVSKKDKTGTIASNENSPVVIAIKTIKEKFKSLLIIVDVCLCSYTSHGHCGVLDKNGLIDNAKSVERIKELAIFYAKAGANVLAPSDMMDGRVKAIKDALIKEKMDNNISVMSYAAKYASCLYGPFRDICKSGVIKNEEINLLNDRSTYQLPIPASNLGMLSVKRDIEEGADFVMVKPATNCLDLIYRVAKISDLPVAAYHVSGEYSMIYYSAKKGMFDLKEAVFEIMSCIKRAGATVIITYFTPRILKWLSNEDMYDSE